MLVTPLFAAIFSLLYVMLSMNVIRHRFSKRISLGSGGDAETEYAVRTHANFMEYVPLALILFYFIEIISLSGDLVFYLASTLLIARVLHCFGMANPKEYMILRQVGVILTLLVLIVASVSLALRYIPISV